MTEGLERQLSQLLRSIRLLHEQELVVAALIVLYAAIDGLAWLQRAEKDSTSDDFRRWVERYLLVSWDGDVTASDLWAARCAMLHNQSAESRHSRKGQAREIWYRWNKHDGIVPTGANLPALPLIVHVDRLVLAFEEAVGRFKAEIEVDPALRSKVEEKAQKLWAPVMWLV